MNGLDNEMPMYIVCYEADNNLILMLSCLSYQIFMLPALNICVRVIFLNKLIFIGFWLQALTQVNHTSIIRNLRQKSLHWQTCDYIKALSKLEWKKRPILLLKDSFGKTSFIYLQMRAWKVFHFYVIVMQSSIKGHRVLSEI